MKRERPTSGQDGPGEEDAKRARPAPAPAPMERSLSGVAARLGAAKRVLVLVGAGISRACGIPDFRSASGIYSMVESMGLGLSQPECLFDLEFFEHDPEPFYKFAHKLLLDEGTRPSRTHSGLRAIEQLGKLQRLYSQNIDGLERAAGIKRVVLCHGSLETARCLACKRRYALAEVRESMVAGCVARCAAERCTGVIKPDVTFFGEPVGARVERMLHADAARADLLLVIGTSLQVAPASKVLDLVPGDVPRVLINLQPIKGKRFDVELRGECDKALDAVFGELLAGASLTVRQKTKLRAALPEGQDHLPSVRQIEPGVFAVL